MKYFLCASLVLSSVMLAEDGVSVVRASPPSKQTSRRTPQQLETDVLIYGGTPAGLAAAIHCGQAGHRVLLIEPYSWIGGLTTNGLSHTDFRTFEGITGTFYEFTQRVQSYYNRKYGNSHPNAACFRGTHGEPHVNRLIWEQWLQETPTVSVRLRTRLQTVDLTKAKDRIRAVTFEDQMANSVRIQARMFIDATYEGDLMAAANVPFAVGRESRSTYDESLAPEMADKQVQGYNFRLVMTTNPDNRILPEAPAGYQRDDFTPILKLFDEGRLKSVFCAPTGGVYKYQPPALPNRKYDINDVSHAAVRLSLPSVNDGWPTGSQAEREKILHAHLRHNLGLLYFLQNDAAVPAAFRRDARSWGLCRDEFVETNHRPEQLYIREARRMRGLFVFTEQQTNHAENDARSVWLPDSIAMGDYGPNCHGTAHTGPRFGGRHTGEFYKKVPPYQIPYGVIVPRKMKNLLVPVACSASHVGFCALRLEPIWTSLGQAAGCAADLAIQNGKPVQAIPVARLQAMLHNRGAATIYVSDVLPGHADFAAVQWWAAAGGLHGMSKAPGTPGQRGKHLFGQYFHAFPGHAVDLKQPLTASVRARWTKIAQRLKIEEAQLAECNTRGHWIRRAYELSQRETSAEASNR